MNALLDKDFLKQLDSSKNREIYARITALSFQELPLETIEGKVSGGSVNIDGASAIRRTCSVSITANEVNINDFYWGLNNKFKLELGLKNNINSNYPDIIWFSQGIFIITAFNTILSTKNFNISISGKDKMCLLNGDVGGHLPASIDFGVEEYQDLENNIITYSKIPIKKIIKEMLHAYALEPYHNIIINNLEDKGLELLEYRGEKPMYLLWHVSKQTYTQMYFDGKTPCYLSGREITLDYPDLKYNTRVDLIDDKADKIKLTLDGNDYTVSKIEYGQTAGYRLTDLVYAGELISNIGESITSILDKIVKMLGNFEYFYDVDGRFIFQEKRTYINTPWNSIITVDNDSYVENSSYIDDITYYFDGNYLINSFQNSPNLSNLKNDYSIWGIRKTLTNEEIPIHYRYAIHKKPLEYVSLNITLEDIEKYNNYYPDAPLSTQNSIKYTSETYDWRELIYQMAKDYYQYNQLDNYTNKLIAANPNLSLKGTTGYEQFYTDIYSFWRYLYNPEENPQYKEYTYSLSDNKTFIPKDEKGKIIENLFVNERYLQINSLDNLSQINRNDIIVYKLVNEVPELHSLLDSIPINYNFDANGKQDVYYVTAEQGFKAITLEMKDQINKKEIYVLSEDGESYQHILDSVNLNNPDYYLKEILDENHYLKVADLSPDIQKIYYFNGEFNKYYTVTELDISGEPIENGNINYKYLKYFIENYEYYKPSDGDIANSYWNKKIKENPDLLDFWIDFLDSSEIQENGMCFGSELDSYAISVVGDRSKVVNDSNVKSIYFRNVPNLIFTTYDELKATDLSSKTGYVFMFLRSEDRNNQASDFIYFTISAQGKSAKESLDELLYNHSYCIESITISALPIYYLQPNTKISIRDEQSKINGEYIINRISLPLTYDGMMTIQATKAPQRVY